MHIFMTGATGYIGGDFLHLLNERHPDWHVSCLVRDESKSAGIQAAYPNVRLVHGTLDSSALVEEEASKVNVVFHFANADHVKSAEAIARGLARSSSRPAYWIHTSGAGILTHENFARKSFGYALESDQKVYDDLEGVSELTSLPDKALHRHVDKIVLAASGSAPDRIKTAIVSPSAIYGIGRGTGNRKSVQLNVSARLALERGKALQVGDGSNIWHGVHIHDLSELYLLLGEAAWNRKPSVSWNDQGYYLAESCSFTWGQVMQAIADEAKKRGFVATNEVQSVEFAEAIRIHKWFPYLCGTTSRGIAKRARTLGWTPVQHGIMEAIPSTVDVEAKALGLSPGRERRLSSEQIATNRL